MAPLSNRWFCSNANCQYRKCYISQLKDLRIQKPLSAQTHIDPSISYVIFFLCCVQNAWHHLPSFSLCLNRPIMPIHVAVLLYLRRYSRFNVYPKGIHLPEQFGDTFSLSMCGFTSILSLLPPTGWGPIVIVDI